MNQVEYKIAAKNNDFFKIFAKFYVNSKADLIFNFANSRPGRYENQYFSKNLISLVVIGENGEKLPFDQIDLSTYLVLAKPDLINFFTVQYTFRNGPLDAGNNIYFQENILNILPCICLPFNDLTASVVLELDVPNNITVNTTLTLDQVSESRKYFFKAENFEKLGDSAITGGVLEENLNIYNFAQDDINYQINLITTNPPLNPENLINSLRKNIILINKKFKHLPFTNQFQFHIFVKKNRFLHALEHLDNTVLVIGSEKIDSLENNDLWKTGGELFISILETACHEYIHCWNIKTLKPKELIKYNYSDVFPFETCYIAEGITTYLGILFPISTSSISVEDLLENGDLDRYINAIFKSEINKSCNFSLSYYSKNLWRDGYNSSFISAPSYVYGKGCLVAFMLDYYLMHRSNNRIRLVDILSKMCHNLNLVENGYSHGDFIGEIKTSVSTLDQINIEDVNNEIDLFFDNFIFGNQAISETFSNMVNDLGMEIVQSEDKFKLRITKNYPFTKDWLNLEG